MMPYIEQKKRDVYDPLLAHLLQQLVAEGLASGDLNYCITQLVRGYWNSNPKYATIASITGVLHDVASEFDRRIVSKYEDGKIVANGDVYL